jgi:hypothetical protein
MFIKYKFNLILEGEKMESGGEKIIANERKIEGVKIGYDLDDVIVDFFSSFLEFYNKKYGASYALKDVTSFWIWEVGIGKNKDEAIRFVDEFHESEYYDKIPLVRGARDGISEIFRLTQEKPLIVTSRALNSRVKTNKSLERHFSDAEFSFQIHYSGDFHSGNGCAKAVVCRESNLDYFVEDCFDYAKTCGRVGTRTFLLRKPWNERNWDYLFENQEISDSLNLVPVGSWQEIVDKIKNEVGNGRK